MKQRLHQCRLHLALLLAGLNGFLGPAFGTTPAPSRHWAYQPVRQPSVPTVAHREQVLSPIDAFVLQELEKKGLDLSPAADRRTLLRRATLDLTGLLPTFEEIRAFEQDPAPDAFEKVIDRLLASPRYGERWGRHWLDVARYAETKDLVLVFGKDRLQPYAYTYRDYVIRAFNSDTPYDQFIREQIAADQVQPAVERWRLAALGFLTVGRLYDNNPHDQIDDQIDTVTRGFLGLTVSCARCHNHKYDEIPTEDYYSLYGVFASSERPYDLPLLEDPARVPGGPEFERSLSKARQELEDHIDAQHEFLSDTARQRAGDYLLRVATTPKLDLSETSSFALSLSPEDLRPGLVLEWRRFLAQSQRQDDPVFSLWSRWMGLPDEGFPSEAPKVWQAALDQGTLNPIVAAVFSTVIPTTKLEVAQRYADLLNWTYANSLRRAAGLESTPPDESECALLAVLESPAGPSHIPRSTTPDHMSRVEKDQYGKLVLNLDKLAAHATNAPPARAMVLRDAPAFHNPRVFVRGSPARLGQAVPRQFLRVLAGDERRPFEHGSGRLDLAQAIAAPNNPLTSRVLVNRVWMHHLGEPLVNSPSDFGTRSDPPTHPELLDYLAWHFVQEGWSLKKLHRLIMLSRAYQQSSQDRAECRQVDPENKLLWRAHRRRLEFEAMRDSMLAVAGRLEERMGGRSFPSVDDPKSRRRTVYGLVDRQDLPAVFRAFDFVCPDQTIERRPRTVVPQQALFAMNSWFVMEQARALTGFGAFLGGPGAGCMASSGTALEETPSGESIRSLYHAVLGREPDLVETARALEFLASTERDDKAREGDGFTPVAQLAQVLLMSNEFMFVD